MIRHVDQDHILGVLAMLKDVERPEEFSDVWFNGCDQLNDNEFESFGPVDGEFLSTAIIEQDCLEIRVPRACDRGGPPQTPFDDTAEFTIIAPDRTLLENLIPGGRKSVATTASSRVWTRRNRYPTTNSNRSAPWTLERLTAAGESMRTGPLGDKHVQHLVSVDSTARRLSSPVTARFPVWSRRCCRPTPWRPGPPASAGTMGSPSVVAAIRSIVRFASTPVGWNSRPGANGRAGLNRQGGDIEIFTRPGVPGPMSSTP